MNLNAKKEVKLHIKGSQIVDDEDTVSDFFVDGVWEQNGDSLTLEYAEPTEHGLGEVRTTLRYDGKTLRMERGEESGLIVERGRRHLCQYGTPFGSLLIGISGGDITLSQSEDRFDMDIHYAIDVNTELASRNHIMITGREAAV